MSVYNRYFLHFLAICMIPFAFIVILMAVDRDPQLQPVFILTVFLSVFFFVVAMTMFSARNEKLTQIVIRNEDEVANKLDDLIKNKFQRKLVDKNQNKIIYKMDGKYKSWLTNSIIVIIEEKQIIIKLPIIFKQDIINKFIIINKI